jgi:hypothetical protein
MPWLFLASALGRQLLKAQLHVALHAEPREERRCLEHDPDAGADAAQGRAAHQHLALAGGL